MLRFDAESHTYHLGDKRIPNVTSILEPLVDYAKVPRDILAAACQRGDYVHKCCEMYLWGTLDVDSIVPEYLPYFQAFERFLAETKFEPELIEQRVFHDKLHYAGTMDIGGVLPPMGRTRTAKRVLIDIKTTFKLMDSVGPQTAAYLEAWNSRAVKALRFEERYGLQLKKDGSYKLEPMRDPSDMSIFVSCLNIYNFMKRK